MTEKVKGKLKWFDKNRGYGFCESGGIDYFVHHSSIKSDDEFLEGDELMFEIIQTEKGFQAINITKV